MLVLVLFQTLPAHPVACELLRHTAGAAAALNRPLVAVYGSTSPGFTPPLADKVEIVRLGLDCSPCFDRTCRFGHYNCLRELMPQPVIEALQRLQGSPVEVN